MKTNRLNCSYATSLCNVTIFVERPLRMLWRILISSDAAKLAWKIARHSDRIRRLVRDVLEEFGDNADGIGRIARKQPIVDAAQQRREFCENRLAFTRQNQSDRPRITRVLRLLDKFLFHKLADFRRHVCGIQ
jgi:hypothetical protein